MKAMEAFKSTIIAMLLIGLAFSMMSIQGASATYPDYESQIVNAGDVIHGVASMVGARYQEEQIRNFSRYDNRQLTISLLWEQLQHWCLLYIRCTGISKL